MHPRWLLVALLASACGDSTPPAATPVDASTPTSPDRINVNCSGPGGLDESAAECNQRLATAIPGARFFVGPRHACDANLFGASCAPLCELSVINPENCMFQGHTGCPYLATDGYLVVVEVNGRRATAAVGAGENCGGVDGVPGTAIWGRVAFADLQTAAMEASAPPRDGGVVTDGSTDAPVGTDTGPMVDRYNLCTTEGMACGTATGDTCTRLASSALLCTHSCASNEDCPGGTCRTFCYKRCGETLGACPTGFMCNVPTGLAVGACIPTT